MNEFLATRFASILSTSFGLPMDDFEAVRPDMLLAPLSVVNNRRILGDDVLVGLRFEEGEFCDVFLSGLPPLPDAETTARFLSDLARFGLDAEVAPMSEGRLRVAPYARVRHTTNAEPDFPVILKGAQTLASLLAGVLASIFFASGVHMGLSRDHAHRVARSIFAELCDSLP